MGVEQQGDLFGVTEPADIGDELDFYETPEWAWNAIAPTVIAALADRPRPYLIEPAAGRGALLGYVLNSVQVCGAMAVELHQRRFEQLRAEWGHMVDCRQGDFLSMRLDRRSRPRGSLRERRALVVLNPPYSKPRKTIGLEFVARSLQLAEPDGYVAALLPLAFAAGKGRAALHTQRSASLHVFAERPGFGGEHDTGSKDYAWFIWDLLKPSREWRVLA